MAIFACAVVGVYYMMNYKTNSNNSEELNVPETKVEKLLAKDLELEYPATVKTVMNLYSQYSKCFYDGEYTEEELPKLLDKYRQLLDPELLANNPVEDQLKSLNEEIGAYGGKGQVIMSYYWPTSKDADGKKNAKEDVIYYTKDGVNYASTTIAYALKQGTDTVAASQEKFILRQDSDKKWKILGWVLVNDKKK